mmetsp:Transcript_3828/g.12379  ORF Transcript_3828/g.12379 Transcript_3828/m.12379 type:complete len:329 (-) Transcript_3828:335-1321(-)
MDATTSTLSSPIMSSMTCPSAPVFVDAIWSASRKTSMATPAMPSLVVALTTVTKTGDRHAGTCLPPAPSRSRSSSSLTTHTPLASTSSLPGTNSHVYGPSGPPPERRPLQRRLHLQSDDPATQRPQSDVSSWPNWSSGFLQRGRQTGSPVYTPASPHWKLPPLVPPPTGRKLAAQLILQTQPEAPGRHPSVHWDTFRVPCAESGAWHGLAQAGGLSKRTSPPTSRHLLGPSLGYGSPPASRPFRALAGARQLTSQGHAALGELVQSSQPLSSRCSSSLKMFLHFSLQTGMSSQAPCVTGAQSSGGSSHRIAGEPLGAQRTPLCSSFML